MTGPVVLAAREEGPGRVLLFGAELGVQSGPHAGRRLRELLAAEPETWLGRAVVAETGPALTLAVYAEGPHPGKPALRVGPEGRPGGELWWVAAAAAGAELRLGPRPDAAEGPVANRLQPVAAEPEALWWLGPGVLGTVGTGVRVLRLGEGTLHPFAERLVRPGPVRRREARPTASGSELFHESRAWTAERVRLGEEPLSVAPAGLRARALVVVAGAVTVAAPGGEAAVAAPGSLFLPAAGGPYRVAAMRGPADLLFLAPLAGPLLPPRYGLRLQRFLAAAGLGSRRQAEALIREGRVTVDGVPAALGVRVDPERQRVAVDGEPVRPPRRRVYYALHKPRGVICSQRPEGERPRAVDLVPAPVPVFPVGRLDVDSEGLLFLTNDGEWANRVAHPRYGVPKVYLVKVRGRVEARDLDRLRRGVWLDEGRTGPFGVEVRRLQPNSTWLRVTLTEGRNREIRRALAALGYPVKRLKRVRIGGVSLHGLAPGQYRELTPGEVEALQAGTPPPSVPPAADDVFLPPLPRRPRRRLSR